MKFNRLCLRDWEQSSSWNWHLSTLLSFWAGIRYSRNQELQFVWVKKHRKDQRLRDQLWSLEIYQYILISISIKREKCRISWVNMRWPYLCTDWHSPFHICPDWCMGWQIRTHLQYKCRSASLHVWNSENVFLVANTLYSWFNPHKVWHHVYVSLWCKHESSGPPVFQS